MRPLSLVKGGIKAQGIGVELKPDAHDQACVAGRPEYGYAIPFADRPETSRKTHPKRVELKPDAHDQACVAGF